MAGLDQERMVSLYMARLLERLKEMEANLGGIDTGESPDTQRLAKELSKAFPDLPPKFLMTMGHLFMAFLDMLVVNNEKLTSDITSGQAP